MKKATSEKVSPALVWGFLGIMLLIHLLLLVFYPEIAQQSLHRFGKLFLKIIPALVGVYFLIFLFNLFFHPRQVKKHLGKESGIKGIFLAIAGGIISTGPIYLWYPLLVDLRNKGMRTMLLTIFLYNRAIKIPLLPMMIYYFGLKFTAVLTGLMILASILDGWIVEKLMPEPGKGAAHG